MLIVTNKHAVIQTVNQPLLNALGYQGEELIGKSIHSLFTGNEEQKTAQAEFNRIQQRDENIRTEKNLQRKDGSSLAVLFTTSSIRDERGRHIGATCIAKDITELNQEIEKRKTTEEKLRYLALHDTLTKLPNRLNFEASIKRSIALSERYNRIFALLFIDIDNFKTVNDTLGHDVGDQLLTEVATRLSRCIRTEDMISHVGSNPTNDNKLARLGGDEFAIILTEISKPHDAGRVAKRILNELHTDCEIADNEIRIGASIGIACYPMAGDKATDIIKHADIAMYRAKELGRNNYQFFTKALHDKHLNSLILERELHNALINEEFYLVYQPIYALPEKKITSMEVLLRWENPTLGFVGPDKFIPVAEETGLINGIFQWVLETACRQHQQWNAPVRMTVNLSARQLYHEELLDEIQQTLRNTQMKPENLTIELTESSIMTHTEAQGSMLQKTTRYGFENRYG